MRQFTKAIWAFISSALGAATTAVAATPTHTFGQVSSLGWLLAAGYVVAVTGGVYGFTNEVPSPTADNPATNAQIEAARLAAIASVQSRIDAVQAELAKVTGTPNA